MARSKSKIKRALFKKERYHKGPTPLNDESREQRRQTRGRKSTLKRKLIGSALLLALAGLIYSFGFIRTVKVEGLDDNTASDVRQLAEAHFDRGWYKRFKPLADTEALTSSIELADSRFSGTRADISLFGDQLIISSTVRQAVARWRTQGDDMIYLMDQSGVVYRDSDADISGLPFVSDTTGLEVVLSTQLASTNVLNFILLLDANLDEQGLFEGRDKTYAITEAPREIQLSVDGAGYVIKLISTRSASDQTAELSEVLDHLDEIGRTPSEYIDLRVDDTAYYR